MRLKLAVSRQRAVIHEGGHAKFELGRDAGRPVEVPSVGSIREYIEGADWTTRRRYRRGVDVVDVQRALVVFEFVNITRAQLRKNDGNRRTDGVGEVTAPLE